MDEVGHPGQMHPDEATGRMAPAEHGASRLAGYLAFRGAGFACALPLAGVREVLAALPAVAPLPDSPPWLLGIFPWRNDLLALIDPTPVLTDATPRGLVFDGSLSQGPGGLGAAVVLGDAAASVALAVESVAELPSDTSTRPALAGDGGRVRPRYLVGILTHPQTGEHFALLEARVALADIMTGLTEAAEGEDGRHE